MAANRTTAIPLNTYPAGIIDIPQANVNNNVYAYGIEIARCTTVDPTIWPDPASTIEIQIEFSFDNGATWQPGGGWSAYGGIYTRRDGIEAQFSSHYQEVPPGTQRRIRAKIILSDNIRTYGNLVTYA